MFVLAGLLLNWFPQPRPFPRRHRRRPFRAPSATITGVLLPVKNAELSRKIFHAVSTKEEPGAEVFPN